MAQIQKSLAFIVMPTDKLSQIVARFDEEEYSEVVDDDKPCTIKEGKLKDGKPVITEYWLRQEANFNDSEPISWFDLGVLATCSAYFNRGDEIITECMIARALTGSKRPKDDMRQAVRDSVIRMMKTIITVDMTATCRAMKRYKTKSPRRTTAILPCELLENVEINGQRTNAIKIHAQSPLMEIAGMKNQVLTTGAALLDMPNLRNTPRVVKVKLFVVTFAQIYARNLQNGRKTPTSLTFDKIYKAAGVSDESRSVKQNAREAVIKIAEWLKTQKIISGFEIVTKEKQSHAIKFIYQPSAQA